MRNSNNPFALGSAVQYLLVANLVVFVLQMWFQMTSGIGLNVSGGWFEHLFGLQPICLTHFGDPLLIRFGASVTRICTTGVPEVWQLVSYMFLHGGLMHIAFNMLALWMFGSLLERIWGMRRFLHYYFFCGIGAGLTVAAIAYLSGGAELYVPTIGASGAVLGLLTAYGTLFPNNVIYMYFFPVRAKYAVWLFGGFSLFAGLSNAFAGISHWGHLGGILFGYIAMNWRTWMRRLG